MRLKILETTNRALTKAMEVIIVVFAIVMVLSCFAQICTRLVGVPLSWSEELSRYMAVWLTFLGAAYALRKGSLVAVEILYNKLHGVSKRVLYIVIAAAVFLFCYILIYYGSAFAMQFMGQQSPALHIPKGIVYLSAPISGVLMVLFQLEQLMDTLFRKEAKD